MKLRELFENTYEAVGDKDVAIIFGRFNPPHFGHVHAWTVASKFPQWFVGTNESTQGPKDPLPFDIKIEAMKTLYPAVEDHLVAEQSWLTLAVMVYKQFGANVTLHIVTDENDMKIHLPYLQKQNGVEGPHGYYKFKKVVWARADRKSEASLVRKAVKENNPQDFEKYSGVPADTVVAGHPYFKLVRHFMLPYMQAEEEKARKQQARNQQKAAKVTKSPVKPSKKSVVEPQPTELDQPNDEYTKTNMAEDAEPVDREFALVKKLGRLGQRIAQSPKLWAKYTEAIDNDNLDWIVSLIQEGTGADKDEVMNLSNLFGEIGGGQGRIVDFAWAVKEGTWGQDFMNPYRQYRSQSLAEGSGGKVGKGGTKPIDKEKKAAMKNASTLPGLNQSTGSAYKNYRMGIALAGAPDYPTKIEADNWIGGDPLLSAYTDEEFEMIKKAALQVGAGTIQNWSGNRSQEVADVNKTSPVAKVKRNKYGV